MLEFLTTNWQTILVLLSAVILVSCSLFNQWRDDKLKELFEQVLEFIKEKTGEELNDITREQIDWLADLAYVKVIAQTLLVRFITAEQWREYVWEGFVKYREWYNTMSADARYILRKT